MRRWSLAFFVVALAAAVFDFGGIAAGAAVAAGTVLMIVGAT